jgi:hypothetical protein
MLSLVADCRLGPRFSLKSVFFPLNTEFTPYRPSRSVAIMIAHPLGPVWREFFSI